MDKKSSLPVLLGYIYVMLPILIFFVGYCNLPTAIIGSVIILVSFYFMIKNSSEIWTPSSNNEKWLLIFTAIICLIWVCSSGIGALVFQNLDHNCRNPIFEHLVQREWPVITDDGEYILTYYIGFWLPAAVIGKIFNNVQIGFYTQVLWAFYGVFLTIYYILSTLKNKTILPVIIFIFFSGLDIIGSIILFNGTTLPFNIAEHLEWWFPGFQFSSMTTQLYWVFNQAIPAWIITMLLYNEKNNKNMIFLYSCMFICSTLPAIGLFPILVWWGFKNGENVVKNVFTKSHIINAVKSGLTFQNIAGGFFITLVSHSYLSNNLSGGISFFMHVNFKFFLIWFLLFFMLEAGLYILCIAKHQYKNPLFWICLASLLIYPFKRIGEMPDFCMRATIPALLILYLFIVQTLDNKEFLKNKFVSGLLILLLAVGSITPIHEMARTVIFTSMGKIKPTSDLHGTNFFGYTENNSFLKYFGKVKN